MIMIRSAIKWSLFVIILMVMSGCATTTATAIADNPLIGKWNWRHVSGSCTEFHAYDAAGYKESWSNQENLRFRYTVQPIGLGLYRVDSEVIYSNGKPDCTGSSTPIGAASTFYIQMLKDGSYFTCHSAESTSCDGTASLRK